MPSNSSVPVVVDDTPGVLGVGTGELPDLATLPEPTLAPLPAPPLLSSLIKLDL